MKTNRPRAHARFSAAFFFILLLKAIFVPSEASVYHRVKPGETLWSISRSYGLGTGELRAVNEAIAATDTIRPGQKLFVPSLLAGRGGSVHLVKPGETLWGISRLYGVRVDDLRDGRGGVLRSDIIRPGQRILIPGGAPAAEPLTSQVAEILRQGRSGRWEYIVIHHSATDTGSARLFDRHHRAVRGYRTMGYHFVVGNGTDNARDGQIEAGLRWPRQWDGAHTRGDTNRKGIGICLVGNFETSSPTRKQMESLVRLAAHLSYKYGIPLGNIRGHGDFDGTTRCPGRNFPWDAFRSALLARGVM